MVERLFAEARPGQEPGINGHGTASPAGDISPPADSAVLDPVPFLIAAGERLDASLDFDQTIGVILDIIVPALADQAAIHLLLEDGRFRRVAARNPTAESEAISQELASSINALMTYYSTLMRIEQTRPAKAADSARSADIVKTARAF